ncbi:hypothetical protein SESBI_45756 [Sesbania bispinosa]|nr:hypothetical protein SESBI_45756 [Sesbania bispinosa]
MNPDASAEMKKSTDTTQPIGMINQFGIATYHPYLLPFTTRLLEAKIPEKFQEMNLSIPPYTGEVDPGHHLDVFMNEMMFQQANEDLQCKIFPRSLQGEALTWFKFDQAGEVPKDSQTLNKIRQGEKESLRSYLSRFYKEAALTSNLHEMVQLHIAQSNLQPKDPLAIELAKNKVNSMTDFRNKAAQFVQQEMHLEESNLNKQSNK